MTISEITSKYNISPHTLRYYEKIGIISPVKRNASGLRDYTEYDCRRIEFALCMRRAGMPIGPLREYVAMVEKGGSTYDQRLELLYNERKALEANIKELQDCLAFLDIKIEHTISYGEAYANCREMELPPVEPPCFVYAGGKSPDEEQ